MYCGCRCFEGDTQKQVFGKILRNEWSWPSNRIPCEKMRDFVELCLQTDAKLRPTAEESCTHEWFGGTMRRDSLLRTQIVDDDILAEFNDEQKKKFIDEEEQKNNNSTNAVKEYDMHTTLFSSLASMVSSNLLQDILVKFCICHSLYFSKNVFH